MIISKEEWEKKVYGFVDETKRIVYNMSDPDNFLPTALLMNRQGEGMIMILKLDKHDVYTAVTRLAFQEQSECIAVCSNTWYIEREAMRKYIDEDGELDYDGPPPSQHPDRKEAFHFWAAYGDKQMGVILPYTRRADGSVKNFEKEKRFGFDDDNNTLKNYLWDAAIERMRNEDFKP
tara:strand:+ start:367 stop:897 length:531 start_codon:yes stop_codon:yes gene_type:complete